MKRMLNNKKAGIGEAITWVVATIIVLVVLLIFMYAANIMGKLREIKGEPGGEISIDVDSQLTTKTQIAFARAKKFDKGISETEESEINKWIAGVRNYE